MRADEGAVVYTTVGNADDADRLGRAMVERRLAGCASVIENVRSTYRWKGEVVQEQEWLIMFKTPHLRAGDLRDAILAEHPYEVPEVLVIPTERLPDAYLAWLEESTAAD